MQKQHFLVLDGLRGIAALAVVLFHFMEWIIIDPRNNFIGHGFLAVDFFFCLSGFVMAYAYDEKIKFIGLRRFLLTRLIRLHPLVIVGSILGLIGFLWGPFNDDTMYSFQETFQLFVCSILMIPYPALPSRSFNLFSLNAPAWSLFWEYVASLAYGFWLWRLHHKKLLFALLLLFAACLGYVSHRDGNLLGGWSGENWEVGGIRLAYSFCAGLFIYRRNWVIHNKAGFPAAAVLLSAALFAPFTGVNWLVELCIVLFYFPFLISLGAGTTVGPRFRTAATFLGDISYPLYMTHYWALWIFGGYLASSYFRMEHLVWLISLSIIVLVLLAFVIMRYIDVPLRRWLQKKYVAAPDNR